ncbi:MAG: sigma-70 family RNA polymerase sigma factor [Cytophagales bacterium]
MKDQEIIESIRRGEEETIDKLYAKYYNMMVKLVTKNSGTEDEAKDIYQDALIVFWQKAMKPEFVLTSKVSTYIYSICNNLWLKELDRKSRLSHEQQEGVSTMSWDSEERKKAINECIAELGETCRKVLTYYYFDGMSMAVIAEKLGFANAETAKTKKYKCKKALDEKVKKKYKASDFLD